MDLSLVAYLASLPVHIKLDPRLDGEHEGTARGQAESGGIGDKRLLREVALRKFGMVGAARRKKRAMQFGSRSAKMNGGEGERKGDLQLGRD